MATQVKTKGKTAANIAKLQADIDRKKNVARRANDSAFLSMAVTESFSKHIAADRT